MRQRRTAEWERAPEVGRPRLLIEDPEAGWFGEFAAYRARGFEVATCTGPGFEGPDCPLLDGGECQLASGADVVIWALDSRERRCRDQLEALRRMHPETVVIVRSPVGPLEVTDAAREAVAALG